jgi:alkylation response protein AidB-like acyl-CoA dehydrogenase
MDFRLTDQAQDALELAEALARDRLAPRADSYDRDISVPHEDFEDLRTSGLLKLPVPREYGGGGSGWGRGEDPLPYLLTIKALATGNPSTAHLFQLHCHAIHALSGMAAPAQRERYFPQIVDDYAMFSACASEPGRTARGQYVMDTKATATAGGYVLNGVKNYCTLATEARYQAVSCTLDDRPPLEGYMWVIVPTGAPGMELDIEWWKPMGMRACVSPQIKFSDCFVPSEDVLAGAGEYLKYRWQSRFHLGFTANFLGSAEAVFAWSMDYVRGRGTAANPFTQLHAGEARSMLDAADSLFLRAVWLWQQERITEAEIMSNEAKHIAMKMVNSVLDKCATICGSSAMFEKYPIQRYVRDMRVHTLHDSVDRAAQVVGQARLGLEYDPTSKH